MRYAESFIFDESFAFRHATDALHRYLGGFYTLDYDLPAGKSGAVSDPGYIRAVDRFSAWLRQQPEVTADWIETHAPRLAEGKTATGPAVMFAHIGMRNIESMLTGTAVAFALIAATPRCSTLRSNGGSDRRSASRHPPPCPSWPVTIRRCAPFAAIRP